MKWKIDVAYADTWEIEADSEDEAIEKFEEKEREVDGSYMATCRFETNVYPKVEGEQIDDSEVHS